MASQNTARDDDEATTGFRNEGDLGFEFRTDDDRRAAVVEAAHAEFSSVGFEYANVGRIARASRISTATLYRLFGSKDELFVSVMARSMNEARGWLDAQKPTADSVADLRRFAILLATVNLHPRTRGLARAFVTSVGRGWQADGKNNARNMALDFLRALAVRLLADGHASGGTPDDIAYFAHAIIVGDTLQAGLWEGDEAKSPLTAEGHADRMITWLRRVFPPMPANG